MPAEAFGDACSDVEDSKPEKDAPKIARFAAGHGVEKILRGLFTHAFERHQVLERERVNVGDIAHEAFGDELFHEHLTATLDVHGAPRAPMFQAASDLRGALKVHASPHHGFP